MVDYLYCSSFNYQWLLAYYNEFYLYRVFRLCIEWPTPSANHMHLQILALTGGVYIVNVIHSLLFANRGSGRKTVTMLSDLHRKARYTSPTHQRCLVPPSEQRTCRASVGAYICI